MGNFCSKSSKSEASSQASSPSIKQPPSQSTASTSTKSTIESSQKTSQDVEIPHEDEYQSVEEPVPPQEEDPQPDVCIPPQVENDHVFFHNGKLVKGRVEKESKTMVIINPEGPSRSQRLEYLRDGLQDLIRLRQEFQYNKETARQSQPKKSSYSQYLLPEESPMTQRILELTYAIEAYINPVPSVRSTSGSNSRRSMGVQVTRPGSGVTFSAPVGLNDDFYSDILRGSRVSSSPWIAMEKARSRNSGPISNISSQEN